MKNGEDQLRSFIGKFDIDNQALIRDTRAALKMRLPACAQLVWDNYNFLVIGYSPTEHPSDYVISIAASAAGVSLSFNGGANLSDSGGVLMGSSKVNRFIRVPSVAVLADPKVDRLIHTAIAACKVKLPWASGGKLVIRSVSAKQRPRTRS